MSTYMYDNDKKDVNLSPLEHKVYFGFYEAEVFRSEDAYRIIENKKTARQVLFRLKKKGFLKQIKRGIYSIVPAQLIGKEHSIDKLRIASKLVYPYYISHHAALEVHGVAHSYFNVVYISTSKILKSFSFQDISYKFITTRYMFGIEQISSGGLKISVSDREKTILDCIRNIGYAGNFEELIKSMSGFSGIDYEKLLKYLGIFNEKSLFHKAGFIFFMLKKELNVPDEFLQKIREKLSRRTYYLITGKKGKYVKEWNIIVPKNVSEMMKVA